MNREIEIYDYKKHEDWDPVPLREMPDRLFEAFALIQAMYAEADRQAESPAAHYDPCDHVANEVKRIRAHADKLAKEFEARVGW